MLWHEKSNSAYFHRKHQICVKKNGPVVGTWQNLQHSELCYPEVSCQVIGKINLCSRTNSERKWWKKIKQLGYPCKESHFEIPKQITMSIVDLCARWAGKSMVWLGNVRVCMHVPLSIQRRVLGSDLSLFFCRSLRTEHIVSSLLGSLYLRSWKEGKKP
jgi:hypothetical protein